MFDRFSKPWKKSEPEKLNKSKRKRIRRKQNKTKTSKLKFFGNNADGIMNKLESLENMLQELPSVFFYSRNTCKKSRENKNTHCKEIYMV